MQLRFAVLLSLLSAVCAVSSPVLAQEGAGARVHLANVMDYGSLTRVKYIRFTDGDIEMSSEDTIGLGQDVRGGGSTHSGTAFASLKNETSMNLTLQTNPTMIFNSIVILHSDGASGSATITLGGMTSTAPSSGGRGPNETLVWPTETYAPGREKKYEGSFQLSASWY